MRFKSISLAVAMAFCFSGYAQNTVNKDSTLVVAENQEAEVAFNAGNDFVAQRNFTEAINSFTKALSINPQFTKALVNRGFAKSEMADYSGAITDFTMAIELDNSPVAYYGRGLAYFNQNNSSDALNDFELAIKAGYDEAKVYYYAGVANFECGNYEESINNLTLSITFDNNNAQAFNDRGSAKRMNEDYDGAIADYQQAIKIDPKLATAYNNLASALLKKGNIDDAISNYGLAIAYMNGIFERSMRIFNVLMC